MRGSRAPSPYRLAGVIDAAEVVFDLELGEQRVGSAAASDLHLPVAGVSRQHAILTVKANGLIVEDRGSRNGTFVEGVRIDRSVIPEGAELRFGPVCLRVDAVELEDRELAITVEAPSSAAGGARTTSLWRSSRVPATLDLGFSGPWLAVVDAFVERLTSPGTGGLADGLAVLVAELPLDGCCVVDWRPGSDAVVCSSSGTVGEVPVHEAVREIWIERGQAAETAPLIAHYASDPPLSLALAAGGPGGEALHGLLCWGRFEHWRGSSLLLRTLFRLIDHRGPRRLDEAPSTRDSKSRPELAFPAGYRPLGSPEMVDLYRRMRQILHGDLPTLILGETGVGKERIARILHDSSDRREAPFVAVNCAAIPAELLEAEMFGIAAGVATGVAQRPGKFQLAERGTLFLDEVGDMAPALQTKLLRALQEKEIHPVGESPRKIDVRVIAATNADLVEKIDGGHFRRDLYYRLAGFVLEVPPLRRCREDVPALIEHFLRIYSRQAGRRIRGVTVKALRRLTSMPWPGNVRELEHVVRALVLQCPDGGAIESEAVSRVTRLAGAPPAIPLDPLALGERILELETVLVREALRRAEGNRAEAARLLQITRNGLGKKIKRLGIE